VGRDRSPAFRLSRRDLLGGGVGTAVWALGGWAGADAVEPGALVPGELPRRVLALYKSHEPYSALEGTLRKTATLNEIHSWAQMPLNWLGMMVDYHDVSRGLPELPVMGRYRGVVTWFQSDDIDDPLAYAHWLGAQVRAGRRVVILGTLGAFQDRRTGASTGAEALAEALRPTGLEFPGRWTTDQRVIEIRFKDPRMVEFERKLPPGLPNYYQVLSRHRESRSHLVLGRRDEAQSDSHMVVTGPWGGFAGSEYVRHIAALPYAAVPERGTQAGVDDTTAAAPDVYVSRWLINPFAFFQDALGIADWPRPDVTTLNGRRIAYSHIDGDGMRNESEVHRGALSGEVILDEILRRYVRPTTVSVVAAEVHPRLLGDQRSQALARTMLALPHVEAGSHSFFHPLDWERKTRSFDLPGQPYSVETETTGSIRYIERHLLPPDKRVSVFQWSGSTRVNEEAIAAVDRLGVPNINGGDSMFDRQWPSYTRVAPLMRQVGEHWQAYTSAANENLYTNLWTGPFYGYKYVVETFRNTETPRRVSPINIYYHFYSGERLAALAALRSVYDWTLGQPVAPIFTSEYLAIVAGFRTTKIARSAEGWRIWNHGALRTLRFDRVDRGVDLARSRGVLGWRRHQGSLYVHLSGPDEALIVLGDGGGRPFVSAASHHVSEFTVASDGIAFKLSGVGPKSVAVGGLAPGREVRVALSDGRSAWRLRVRADRDGVVAFDAGAGATATVRLS